jgi:hypothetical protein
MLINGRMLVSCVACRNEGGVWILTLRLALRDSALIWSLGTGGGPTSPAQDRENDRPRDPPRTRDFALTRT